MTTEVIAAFIGAIGVVLVAIIGAIGASKLGIGTNQEKLVQTLKDLITGQDKKIAELNHENALASQRIRSLEIKVKELEELTVDQAQLIHKLQSRVRGD